MTLPASATEVAGDLPIAPNAPRKSLAVNA